MRWSRAFVFCLFILQVYQIWGVTGRSMPRKGSRSICNLPKVTGPCRAYFPRWYFNRAKGICERFIYGGCRGNANNFRTKRDCERKCGGRICRARVDLAFIIDGSGSIEQYGKGNFRRCLNFVKAVVKRFNTDNGQIRIGVVLFSTRPRLIFRFGRYRHKISLLRAISRIPYPGGWTKTGWAMRYTLRHVFRYARKRVRKVAIVMTDGKSQDNVLHPAKMFRARGIKCYAVGIGHKFNRHQLLQIAGGNRKHALTAGFRSLPTIVGTIGRRACRGSRSICNLPKVTGPCRAYFPRWYFNRAKGICERFIYGGCRGNANNFRTKRDCERKCGGRTCRVRVDLAFIIDGSRSIERHGRGNFRRCLHFVKAIIRKFDTNNGQTRVAVVLFSSKSWLIFRFGQYRRKSQLLRKISRIRYPRGGSKIGKAMRFTLRHVFRHARRSRRVRKVAIVMTDGKSQDNFLRPAQRFLARRIRCYAVGIGQKFNRHQLLQIAGGNRKQVLTAGFRSLHTIVRSIRRRACRVCRARVDLAFIIDGSGSIEHYGKGNFRRCLNFVKAIVKRFNTDNGQIRIGVVLFSTKPRLIFRFGRYRHKISLLRAISRIPYPRGWTKTGWAMRYTLRHVFRYARKRVRKVAIVMTDGKSQDNVLHPAKMFRARGIKCYAVGIGHKFNRHQLLQIAGGNRKHVLTAGFRSLPTIVGTIGRRACRGSIRPVFPTLPVSGLPFGSVSYIPITADIAFLIDGSCYVGRRNFRLEKAFIKSIARRFTIGKHHSHIGVATYHRRPHLRMRLNQYGSLRSVKGALNRIRYPNRNGRRVDLGMWACLRYFFSGKIKRSFVRKILVVLVSGRQTKLSPYIIRRLPSLFRRLDVQVYVVSIGRIDHRYLQPISYINRHVYVVRSYHSLVSRAGSIARAIHVEMGIERERYYDQAMA